ncbi:MAG TPA: hypothetical protein VLQ68_09350, partial [Rhizobiaceae bacterium]|nr:hypothetical protein [Rhizobiaceae bacterium]
ESDIETVRARYVASLIKTQKEGKISGYVGELREDGSWPDIDYKDKDPSNWARRSSWGEQRIAVGEIEHGAAAFLWQAPGIG